MARKLSTSTLVDKRDKQILSPLHLAVLDGDLAKLRSIAVDEGSHALNSMRLHGDEPPWGSPSHVAAYVGRVQILDELKALGANVEISGRSEFSARREHQGPRTLRMTPAIAVGREILIGRVPSKKMFPRANGTKIDL
jgi:hypothetical protein